MNHNLSVNKNHWKQIEYDGLCIFRWRLPKEKESIMQELHEIE